MVENTFVPTDDGVYEAVYKDGSINTDKLGDQLERDGFRKDNNRYISEDRSMDVWLDEDAIWVRLEADKEPDDFEYEALGRYLEGYDMPFNINDWLDERPDYHEDLLSMSFDVDAKLLSSSDYDEPGISGQPIN